MKTAAEIANKTAAYVVCHGGLVQGDPGCGQQALTELQYEHQLSLPNKGWRCPTCGNSADYDDEASERVQGMYDEVEGSPAGGTFELLELIPAPVLDEIGIERERQKSIEGHTSAADDQLGSDLAAAAGCYALFTDAYPNSGQPPPQWPLDAKLWKPKDYRRDLVRAGALIIAAIDAFDRSVAMAARAPA